MIVVIFFTNIGKIHSDVSNLSSPFPSESFLYALLNGYHVIVTMGILPFKGPNVFNVEINILFTNS